MEWTGSRLFDRSCCKWGGAQTSLQLSILGSMLPENALRCDHLSAIQHVWEVVNALAARLHRVSDPMAVQGSHKL